MTDPETGSMPPPPPPPLPPKTPVFIPIMNMVNTITHIGLGAVTLMAVMFANYIKSNIGQSTSLTTHIYLCVTGYVILMSQAVLSLSPFTGWTQTLKFNEKRTIHWTMQISGSTLALAGSIIRIIDMETNFNSTHGILGIVAMIMTICSLIGGLINLVLMRIKLKQVIVRVFHSCLGNLTLIVAYLALVYGFHETGFRPLFGETNANLAISLTVLTLAGTTFSAMVNTVKKAAAC